MGGESSLWMKRVCNVAVTRKATRRC